jgi:hypothetical protein
VTAEEALERPDIFDVLKDQATFVELVDNYFRSIFTPLFLDISIAEARLREAHIHWQRDLKRVENIEYDGDELDHFKHCGHLAYWLRRFSPIVECYATPQSGQISAGNDLLSELEEQQKILYQYANQYSAFELGFRIVRFFEWNKVNPNRTLIHPDRDFVITACHVLKEKNISPHSLHLIYRALFVV